LTRARRRYRAGTRAAREVGLFPIEAVSELGTHVQNKSDRGGTQFSCFTRIQFSVCVCVNASDWPVVRDATWNYDFDFFPNVAIHKIPVVEGQPVLGVLYKLCRKLESIQMAT